MNYLIKIKSHHLLCNHEPVLIPASENLKLEVIGFVQTKALLVEPVTLIFGEDSRRRRYGYESFPCQTLSDLSIVI